MHTMYLGVEPNGTNSNCDSLESPKQRWDCCAKRTRWLPRREIRMGCWKFQCPVLPIVDESRANQKSTSQLPTIRQLVCGLQLAVSQESLFEQRLLIDVNCRLVFGLGLIGGG
jgi:hypothetical protein